MRVEDTCQAHWCAGRAVGLRGSHWPNSPRALSSCTLRRRAPHRVGRRPHSPAARGAVTPCLQSSDRQPGIAVFAPPWADGTRRRI